MKISRNEHSNSVLVAHDEEYNDIKDYLTVLIDVFSATRLPRSKWLTIRETDFFIACVVAYHSGFKNYKSDEADFIYDKIFGQHNKKERSIYLKKLEKKKWVVYSNDEIEINPFFSNITLEDEGVNFNINVNFNLGDENYG